MPKGFSLVEVMVAMMIGLFLTLGLYSMFNMSVTNIKATTSLNQLQGNGRMALAILTDDISQASFWGDMTGTSLVKGINTQLYSAHSPESFASTDLSVTNDCIGGGQNNASLPNNSGMHFRMLWGYEHKAGLTAAITCLKNVAINTDILQIKRLSGPNHTASLTANRIYVATTASEAVFFSSDTKLTLVNARFWQYKHHLYYIKDGDIPSLYRKGLTANGMTNDEQLVDGIENIRILYGVDINNDNVTDDFISAEMVTDNIWNSHAEQRIIAVRVHLLIRAIEADPSYTNSVTYTLGDKTLSAKDDHYRRKVLSTTIPLENSLLM